jgi:hypothetical protein
MDERIKRRLAGLLLVLCAAGLSPQSFAAAGWTDYGTLVELNQNPPGGVGNELLFMRVSVTTNPSDPTACSVRDGFYLPITTDFQKRLFAMLMMAKASAMRVRVYHTGTCHTWGYAEIQGVLLE